MTRLQVYRHGHAPFRDVWNLPEEMNRLFWGLSRATERDEESTTDWSPAVDVYEDAEALKLHAELPGLKKEEVKIQVHEGVLTLRGERKLESEEKKDNYFRVERRYGSFLRSFSLPNTVDAEKIRATMKDGVLELVIPKKAEAKPKEIQVEIKNG